ncbi:MAG: polyprenyl synthetase family protein [Candidatus Syntrophosphaera sp.]
MLLQKYFETRQEMIEASLKGYLGRQAKPAKELKQAMHHAVFSGGKRWRPMLLIAMYEMLTGMKLGKGLQDAVKAAAAVELLHNAALVHDDMPMVMNRAERRSGQAVHLKFDNTIGILAGDALYTLAFEVLGQISKPANALACARVLAGYAKTYGMIGGQAVALESKRKVMKINTLRFIDMKKEGSLMQATADMACNLAGADENTRQTMNTYASNLALAYQMIEDISADYNRGSEGLDFDEEFVPTSRRTYTGLLGFDKARNAVERLLDETTRMIQPFEHNDVLMEFVQMVKERMP